MNGVLFAQGRLSALLLTPVAWVLWGLLIAGLGLWLMLDSTWDRTRQLGKVISAVGLVIVASAMPKINPLGSWTDWTEQIVFWLLAGITLVCSAAAVTARNPVYTAIWFAGSLLGAAGLFLFQNALFLGLATVVVYAGAIVVTFLFVLMLANPEGHSRYDRISWSRFAAPAAIIAALVLLAIIATSFSPPQQLPSGSNILAKDHMVQLGTEMFSKHLIAVEVAGTLLLIALVGAVAIVIQGKPTSGSGPGAANRRGGPTRSSRSRHTGSADSGEPGYGGGPSS